MLEYRLLEKKLHGSSNFPFHIYHVDAHPGKQNILPFHWHEETEMILIRSGEGVFTVNQSDFAVEAGDCILINSGDLHGANSDHTEGCSYTAVVFKLSWLSSLHPDICQEQILNPLLRGEIRFPHHLSQQRQQDVHIIRIIADLISDYMEKEDGNPLQVKGRLWMLLASLQSRLISKESEEQTNAPNQRKWKNLMRVLAHIDQNYQAPLSLDELASIGAMSPSHLCRLFKELTGMRPVEYIQLLRVNSAALMLQHNDCKIVEAALENGFHHLSYFSKQFKKYKGVSPSAFKRMHKQQK